MKYFQPTRNSGTTPMDMLIDFLGTQDIIGVIQGDWDFVDWEIKTNDLWNPPGTNIHLNKARLGFCFDHKGRFMGISNYQ